MLSVRNCGDYRIGNSLRALLFFILDWQIQKAVWALQDALLARREHGRQEESNSQRGAQHARNTAHTIKMAVTTACIYSPSYILPNAWRSTSCIRAAGKGAKEASVTIGRPWWRQRTDAISPAGMDQGASRGAHIIFMTLNSFCFFSGPLRKYGSVRMQHAGAGWKHQ